MQESDKLVFYILGLHYLSQESGVKTAASYLKKLSDYKNSNELLNKALETIEAEEETISPPDLNKYLTEELRIKKALKLLPYKAIALKKSLGRINKSIEDQENQSQMSSLEQQLQTKYAERNEIEQQIRELPKMNKESEIKLHKELQEVRIKLADEYVAQMPETRENLAKAYQYYSLVIQDPSSDAAVKEASRKKRVDVFNRMEKLS